MERKFRKPYRIKRKKSIFKKRFFWLTIFALIMAGGIFYLICFSSPFQIKEVQISGIQKIAPGDLEKAIQYQITRTLFFTPTRSIFLVNSDRIKEIILKKFPQISQIDLKQKLPNTLEVKVKERKSVAVFSQEEKYFSLDKEGIIFEEVAEAGEHFKIKGLNQNQFPNLGDKAVKKELLLSILEIESKLREDFKIPLLEFLIISDENVRAKTFEGWEIYFDPKGDLAWQLTKLKAVLEKEIPPENRKNLEYIELRFGNFAPYKYRQSR